MLLVLQPKAQQLYTGTRLQNVQDEELKGWDWLAFTKNLTTKGSVICIGVTQCWADFLFFNEYSTMIPVSLWQRCLMLGWNKLKASLTVSDLSCVSATGMVNRIPENDLWGEYWAIEDHFLDKFHWGTNERLVYTTVKILLPKI